MKIQRNDICPCNSGKKYKKCCLQTDNVIRFKASPRLLKNIEFVTEINPEIEDICDQALQRVKEGDVAHAKEVAGELLFENPDYYMPYYVMGVCLIQENNIVESIAYFKKATELFPFFIESHYNLAVAYVKRGQVSDAIGSFRRVIELDKNLENLGRDAKKQLDELTHLIESINGCTVDDYIRSETIYHQAFACIERAEYQKAILLFEKVLGVHRDHVQSFGNMGLSYLKLGNKQKAIECFDKALAIDPNYQPALLNKMVAIALDEQELLNIPEITTSDFYRDRLGL